MSVVALFFSFAYGSPVFAARKEASKKTFGDWTVFLSKESWGDNKKVILRTKNLSIEISYKYGFLHQKYSFSRLRSYWPYCEVTDFAYRIDGGHPVHTGMGGDAASSAACGWITMPSYMLKDMRSGKHMDVRAGYGSPQILNVSLVGFSAAWSYAETLVKVKIMVETWMTPND